MFFLRAAHLFAALQVPVERGRSRGPGLLGRGEDAATGTVRERNRGDPEQRDEEESFQGSYRTVPVAPAGGVGWVPIVPAGADG